MKFKWKKAISCTCNFNVTTMILSIGDDFITATIKESLVKNDLYQVYINGKKRIEVETIKEGQVFAEKYIKQNVEKLYYEMKGKTK